MVTVITGDTIVVSQNNHQHLFQEWSRRQRVHVWHCVPTQHLQLIKCNA